jgi:hypothetical protein
MLCHGTDVPDPSGLSKVAPWLVGVRAGACARCGGSRPYLDHPQYGKAKVAMVCTTVVSGAGDGDAHRGGGEEG